MSTASSSTEALLLARPPRADTLPGLQPRA
jgi:hypothetical protein